jgi:hypothetical protein
MRLAPHVQVGGLTENPTMPLYTGAYEVIAMIGIELYNRLIDAGHSPRRRQHQRISQE